MKRFRNLLAVLAVAVGVAVTLPSPVQASGLHIVRLWCDSGSSAAAPLAVQQMLCYVDATGGPTPYTYLWQGKGAPVAGNGLSAAVTCNNGQLFQVGVRVTDATGFSVSQWTPWIRCVLAS